MSALVDETVLRTVPAVSSEPLVLLAKAVVEPSLCSVRAAGRPESYLSRTLVLTDDGAALCVDVPKAPVLARALQPGATAELEITLRHVRLSFATPVECVTTAQGRAVLRLSIPTSVRLRHRRETGRVGVPRDATARFTLDALVPHRARLRVHDIGNGGACIAVHGALDEFTIGRVYDQAHLSLDDARQYVCAVRVCHASAVRMPEIRLGLQFVRTSIDFELAVAQFIEDIARSGAAG